MTSVSPSFIGREEELEAIRSALARGFRLIVISGVVGIGKTALVDAFLSSTGHQPVQRINLYETRDRDYGFAVFLDTMDRHSPPPMFIVIDGAELVRGDLLQDGVQDLLHRFTKARIIVTSRHAHDLAEAAHIRMGGLRLEEATEFLAQSPELTREDAASFARSLDNHPLALQLLLHLAQTQGTAGLREALGGKLRNVIGAKFYSSLLATSGAPLTAETKIGEEVRSKVIVVQNTLVTDLKRRPEAVAFFVMRHDGMPAGCGGVKLFGTAYGEIKRMYVCPQFRGLGLGKLMLRHLADYARRQGVAVLRLETGIYQPEAIGLYECCGFRRIPPFGAYKEDPLSVLYEKCLT